MSSDRHFGDLLEVQWGRGKFVCVGLDPDRKKLPPMLASGLSFSPRIVRWMCEIVDATKDIVCAYKLNFAFYEALWGQGTEVLRQIIDYIHRYAPDVLVIIDGKRADIGNTNLFTAEGLFQYLNGDALTVHPYLGREALEPFLKREEKGIFALCRTSNKGASEFQDLQVLVSETDTLPLYQVVARNVTNYWNENGNCGLVVGATYPEELKAVRHQTIAPHIPILIPGVGTQGGDLVAAVQNGRNKAGTGFIINSSSGVIFASDGPDFAQVAREKTLELHTGITAANTKETTYG